MLVRVLTGLLVMMLERVLMRMLRTDNAAKTKGALHRFTLPQAE